MQLNPGERSLLAYFIDKASAHQALVSLTEQGFAEIAISPMYSTTKTTSPYYLSSLVYTNNSYDKSYGPLLAADPMVSGLSSYADTSHSYQYILSMIVDSLHYATAATIIRAHGGLI